MFLDLVETLSLVEGYLMCAALDSSYLATTLGYSCFFTEIAASLPNLTSSGCPCGKSLSTFLALVKKLSYVEDYLVSSSFDSSF